MFKLTLSQEQNGEHENKERQLGLRLIDKT
jgi:hypothetical protein